MEVLVEDKYDSGDLVFYVNGEERKIKSPDPAMTLLTYLRTKEKLTGTKLGCGEGGCGACTVMVSFYNSNTSNIVHLSANACLMPICSLDGCAVTTVEGIGGMRQGLHPIQQRIATMHGSQCGFCTPGIVMAIYTQLRSFPNSNTHDIEECLDGNLCRCTGYRPILDAAKSLVNDKSNICCMGGSGICPCKQIDGEDSKLVYNDTKTVIESEDGLNEYYSKKGFAEPIFPPPLMRYKHKQVVFQSDKCTWYQPISIVSFLSLKQRFPQAKIIVGNTEVGIETKFKGMEYNVLINPSHINELSMLNIEEFNCKKGLRIGASVTINNLRMFIKTLETNAQDGVAGLLAIHHMLTWFASNHIRNVACVAGNIITASPISDLNPMLLACDATLRMISVNGFRNVNIKDFFLAYRKVDIAPDEILHSIFVPLSSKFEFVLPMKQARRREDDISIVTAGIRIALAVHEDQWVINEFAAAFGGMAPTTILATKTGSILKGRKWNSETFDIAFKSIRDEMFLPANVPGGQSEYRTSLTVSFIFKSFLTITNELQELLQKFGPNQFPALESIDPRERSGMYNFITTPKPSSRGEQTYHVRTGGMNTFHPDPLTPSEQIDRGLVGSPVMHKSAQAQVTGSAIYTDDIQLTNSALHAALVTSTKAHAKIINIDWSGAESCPGFVKYFCAKDVIGSNNIGAVIKDEEVFATEYVKHYGAVIGTVVAETREQALYAAKKVLVTYEDLPAIISIEDAIEVKSFFPSPHEIAIGDLDKETRESEVIVEGTCKVGGQEHFYLETNCTVAIPTEHGLEIFSSTQNPTKTQNFCASVCGLPASNVVARTKRLGGGFGGKETRSVFIAVTAALAAHLLQRPVSIYIDRDLDMSITGQRHAFVIKYKAGCTRAKKLKFIELELYSNAGFSLDLSQPIIDRALLHCDNVYKWPALKATGIICLTNQPSHTAFRGFGGPQGMMATEFVMEHLAHAIGCSVLELRENNLYSEGDVTHFRQKLEDFYIPRLMSEIKVAADSEKRIAEIAEFNSQNRWRKRGLTILPTKFGINFTAKFMNQGGALVHVYTDGTVLVSHGGTEMGQGLHTKMIQVVADCFKIPDTLVTIAETATNVVANSSPTAASASTDLYGMATLDACEQILRRLEPLRKSLSSDVSWKELIIAAFFQRIDLSAHGYYAIDTNRCGYDFTKPYDERGHPFNYFTQGVGCVEVEVDCLTGDHVVNRVDIVMDVGKSINPALDIGQIEGAFVQGSGWSTLEELVWGDKQHRWVRQGQLFTRGPGTYKIPAFNDVPLDFRIHLSNTENKFCVHSSKAIGEPPFLLGCGTFFAIQYAIAEARKEYDNSGSYYQLNHPATSERIRMACRDQFTATSEEFKPCGSW